MAEVVGRELDLVVVNRKVGVDGHDTGIRHQDVKSLRLGCESGGGFPDGVEGGDVAGDESDLDVWGGVAEFGDQRVGGLAVAAREEYMCRRVLGELSDGSQAVNNY